MFSKTIILLVEDDEDDRLFFREAIRDVDEHIQLIMAGNGLEALQQLQTMPSHVDVVFMDINMPLLNGFECLQAIKQLQELDHIPVVMLSTSRSVSDVQRAIQLGALLCIFKLPDFPVFSNSIINVLETMFPAVFKKK